MKKFIDMKLSYYLFKENDEIVMFCPELNVSGGGETKEEAQQEFLFCLNEYFKFQAEHGTLEKDLADHGWKNGNPPSPAYMLKRYPELRQLMTSDTDFSKSTIEVNNSIPSLTTT